MFVKIKENQDSHQKKTRARLFSTAEVRKTGWLTAAGHCTKAAIETADRTTHPGPAGNNLHHLQFKGQIKAGLGKKIPLKGPRHN